MADVFISYARETRDTAESLATALREHNWEVWWDRDLVVGDDFDEVIRREIDIAGCVLVLWSVDSVKSDYVRGEASHARDRGSLLPARIEECDIPLQFTGLQTADLVGWTGARDHPGVQELLSAIAVRLGSRAESAPEPRPDEEPSATTHGREERRQSRDLTEPAFEGNVDPAAVPLIDRREELEWLRTRARGVQASASGRLITVVGPRGVGKSRVVAAFADWCRDRQMMVLEAQSVGRTAEPLLPVTDAVRSAIGRFPEKIEHTLRNPPDLMDEASAIGRILDGAGQEPSAGPPLGGANPRSLYEMLASVMVRFCPETGLVLILEDAPLADSDTLSFLTYLVNKARDNRALIVVTVPSEEQGDPVAGGYLNEWLGEWAEKGAEQLTIRPFGPEEVALYLEVVSGDAAVDQSRVNFMAQFTGGNPLLLSEAVAAPGEGFADGVPQIPDRIRTLLRRRLGQFDDDLREFLEAAAVVNETSHELDPILQVLDVDNATAFRTLRRACAANSLCESDHGRVLFTSELLRMVVYEELGPSLRDSLHLRAGEYFERQHNYSAAAHHYASAQEWRRMVPAAFSAAEAAEHVGLYRASVDWYRRIEPHGEPNELVELRPRLAEALMVVGEWDAAEELVAGLPGNEPRTLLLHSRLSFVRGEVADAARYATRALGGADTDDIAALLLLANIRLYSGDFADAAGYADRALRVARDGGLTKDQSRCHIVSGACQVYNGDLQAAERSFHEGIALVESSPPAERDEGVHSALLGNRGFVEELQERWDEAQESHSEALRLRVELADAVGIIESTLALGRVALGRSAFESASEHLEAAQRLAEDLDEELQLAKIIHARGELAAQVDDASAVELVRDARRRFQECGTLFDVAYADLSLSRILADSRPSESLERLAAARAAVERKGFVLLQRLYPELGPPLVERIQAGLLAYAAGDALGLPWEGRPPVEVEMSEVESLPGTDSWESGSTSDDTALTLLVAEHLADAAGLGDPIQFLETLTSRSSSIAGLGPSTTRAIEHFAATGEPDESGSNTNGAVMRALPIGWAVPAAEDSTRREWTIALTRMTHTGQDAITAACVMSACAAWAIEGAQPPLLIEIAQLEAVVIGPETAVPHAVAAVSENTWEPPPDGITLDPAETVAAVLYSCRFTDGLRDALRRAVSLGGDTDTVAALVGGLLGSQLSPAAITEQLSWIDRVKLPARERLAAVATSLAETRLAKRG